MRRSPPTLHPPVLVDGDQIAAASRAVSEFYSARIELEAIAPAEPDTIEVPLTTVSRAGLFDADIAVRLRGAPAESAPITLLVDSGNTTMVLPYWEAITSLPDWEKTYTLLGEGFDPWRVPAAVVRGPIDIEAANGSILSIEDCVFFACTADSLNQDYPRTANFGTGCITNWPVAPDGVSSMQPPLSLVADHPIASFRYAPAETVLNLAAEPKVTTGSSLVMHKSVPPDVRFFDIVADTDWMALVPETLSIGTSTTA